MEAEFDYVEIVKQALVPGLYADSQVGSSIKAKDEASKLDIKRKLFGSIMDLVRKADVGTLKNDDIRKEIKQLADKAKISVGQAQKVINIYLKYYCVLKWGNHVATLRELDCPIDSGIADEIWERLSTETQSDFATWLENTLETRVPPKGAFMQLSQLQNMDFPFYEWLQVILEKMGEGIRVRSDVEIYDKKRIEDFLSSGDDGT
jgi:hypothetical protein